MIPPVNNITGKYASPGRGWRLKYTITGKSALHYGQRGSRIFPRHRDGVLILSTIHRRGIVIAVIVGPRFYRDGVRHRNRCVFGIRD